MGVDVVMRQHGGRPSDFRRGTGWAARTTWWSGSGAATGGVDEPRGVRRDAALADDARAAGAGRQAGVPDRVVRGGDQPAGPAAYPAEELAGLYRARWHAELDIRSIKQRMRMDVLRCKTPAMVRKEIWAHLLVYNLIRGVMAEAARRQGRAAAAS